MAKLSSVKQDISKQNDGVWLEWERGIWLRIARMGNDRYKAELEAQSARNLAAREKGEPEVSSDEFFPELLAKTVLTGWRNVEDDSGSPLPYTWERGAEALRDPALRDMANFVSTQSVRRANYLLHAEASAEKNSSPLSLPRSASAGTSGER